ncbi:MAG TPA: YncE family protein [Gemmatimonadales bacterium]|nr:YncE family protein [Gemmatimonadales bacterium]
MRRRRYMREMLLLGAALAATPLAAQTAAGSYQVGVVSESGDRVTWLRPEGNTLVVDRVVPVGVMPADIDGPHNITVSPDQRWYYVSIAHGTPYGTLWRFDAGNDTVAGRAPLELFPTTISVTPDGEFAFVANSDFHGDHPRVNSVSAVYTPEMVTITDIPACDMPHGVKVNHAGTAVWVSCMHSDELLQIDAASLEVARRAATGSGMAMPAAAAGAHAGMSHAAPASAPAAAPPVDNECAPTFVSVSPDDRTLYVACNHKGTLQVWDADALTMRTEIPVGAGAYNVEPSPDGRYVVVTNKKAQSVSVVDAKSLKELARIPTTKKIVHGVAYSPDSRLAYVTQESIGADPGAVDVIDLATLTKVSTTPLPAQPTGITILKR